MGVAAAVRLQRRRQRSFRAATKAAGASSGGRPRRAVASHTGFAPPHFVWLAPAASALHAASGQGAAHPEVTEDWSSTRCCPISNGAKRAPQTLTRPAAADSMTQLTRHSLDEEMQAESRSESGIYVAFAIRNQPAISQLAAMRCPSKFMSPDAAHKPCIVWCCSVTAPSRRSDRAALPTHSLCAAADLVKSLHIACGSDTCHGCCETRVAQIFRGSFSVDACVLIVLFSS